MAKKEDHRFWRGLGRLLPYVFAAVAVIGFAAAGSNDKNAGASVSLDMSTMASSDSISADQISELYVVASLSTSFDLASSDMVSGNYVSASVLREISQTSADRIEKPGYVAVTDGRGVSTHIVADGETMASIAATVPGLTTDQIRWSNNLKTTDLSVGQVLSIPATVAGIVYTVKAGDNVPSIASKYGSSERLIISYNDLENAELTIGMKIVLPGGSLPETERPEYVPVYSYSYYGSASDRQDMRVVYDEYVNAGGGNRMVWGQCTYYAWWWRWSHGMSLDANANWGDAKYWAGTARSIGMVVDKTPSYGAVFQTPQGWYGHVGVVLRVYDDGSILVREMNYGYRVGVVTESVIPANSVSNFNYIH